MEYMKKTLKFYNLSETCVEQILSIMKKHPEIEFSIEEDYIDGVIIKLKADKTKSLVFENLVRFIKNSYPEDFYGEDDETMEYNVVKLLLELDKNVAVAESCTGGLLASTLVNVPGVSKVFKGGIIAYDNDIKEKVLGVSRDTLKNFGAVSEKCVKEMLEGTKRIFGVDCCVAISGIAGPSGGTMDKPVGTVFIGVNCGEKTRIFHYNFKGDRNTIRKKSVMMALDILRRILREG